MDRQKRNLCSYDMIHAGSKVKMDKKDKKVEKCIYGGVILFRMACPGCGDYNFMVQNNVVCNSCGHIYSLDVEKQKKIRQEVHGLKRRQLSKYALNKLIEKQNGKCYWCGRYFGTKIIYHDKIKTIRAIGDHHDPFVSSRNSTKENFVASCQLCNSFKSDRAGDDDTIRKFVESRWERKTRNKTIVLLFQDEEDNDAYVERSDWS